MSSPIIAAHLNTIDSLQQMTDTADRILSEAVAGDEPGGNIKLDLAALKAKYQNCVVKIDFTRINNLKETKFNPTKSESYLSGNEPSHASGFFISETEILTCAHVVEEARRGSIRVTSPATGNVEFNAEILGIGGSEAIDLALLSLPEDEIVRYKRRSGQRKIPYLEFGDSDQVRQADELAIFGYPESSDELKIIKCEVTGRQYLSIDFDKFVCGHQFIEVGPAGVVQSGNSGGPALNREGNVVGIPSRGNWRATQGWLIPAKVVCHFLDQVRKSDQGRIAITYPKLGLRLTENFPGTAVWTGATEDMVVFELGVVVREVIPGSLADDWGIGPNDIIVGFANEQQGISCALDFKGYRVVTGAMRRWPPKDGSTVGDNRASVPQKLHFHELVMLSEPGDEVTLWILRKDEPLKVISRIMRCKEPVALPHLGIFEKPEFELWGDFVAQDFTDYTCNLYEVPAAEVLKGGALVTFVEPNSLASRRGMNPQSRDPFGFEIFLGIQISTQWVIIDLVNGQPVRNLNELKEALRSAEATFKAKVRSPNYDPAKKAFMRERYAQIGFRTNSAEGRVLHLTPGFPIDEALECRPDYR
jgi:S1-C subfamily serine protease